jgi:hypothetical protein
MRQRYSKTESLNRILRLLQNNPVATDVPGTPQGEILSESEALSDVAELLAGSLPSQNVVSPLAFLHYGHMYAHNVTGTVDIITQDVLASLTGSVSSGLLKDFTFIGSHLVCGFAGTYFVNWSQSVYSASANQEIEGSIMLNTTPQSGSSAHAEATGASKSHALSGSMIVKLANGDIIHFCVANHTGTTDLVVQHANMTVQWVAPY